VSRLIALLLLPPVLVVLIPICILIAATSNGPIFFSQHRIGKDKKEFTIYKLRTIEVATPEKITQTGKFLRQTKLDELPQVFNLLNGTMHLIGPRPYSIKDHQKMSALPGFNQRYTVKPGITGYAQSIGLHGPMHSTRERLKRLEADLYYIKNRSLVGDIRIIFKTLKIALNL